MITDLPVEILGRLCSDGVMRRPTPLRVYVPTGGRPPKHGGEFVFAFICPGLSWQRCAPSRAGWRPTCSCSFGERSYKRVGWGLQSAACRWSVRQACQTHRHEDH
ncbi:hypothetical protein AV521_44080 [Streptomyces sp. IMTB 2501]|nr:hypothetical protein AV521_44080 [Streptomyces sp. IMTB 2501]